MALRKRWISGALILAGLGSVLAWAWQPDLGGHTFGVLPRLGLLARGHWPGVFAKSELSAVASTSPAASRWWDTYLRAKRSAGGQISAGSDAWIRQKLDRDWNDARTLAAGGKGNADKVPDPPAELLKLAGTPPPFAEVAHPIEYSIQLVDGPDGHVVLRDHPSLPRQFRSYRNAEGVMFEGTPISHMVPERLTVLREKNGVTGSRLRVWEAVSEIEGGFDSVNTYDTGYVSAGFVQFTTGRRGNGVLAEVLRDESAQDPFEFDQDFRQFGIDVDEQGILCVVDPTTGLEERGSDAVSCVMKDPRLAAVFVQAGRRSPQYQAAQLRVASRRYFPSDDPISVRLNDGTVLRGRVSDAVRSEVGLATLLSVKVNIGNLGGTFAEALQREVTKHNCRNWDEIARFESSYIGACKSRIDFGTVGYLSKPPRVSSEASP